MTETPESRSEDVTRVLVIEDDHHLRDLLEIVLDLEQGVEVATLSDGRQAVEAFRRYQPDVVVLDLMLPHVSGDEVAAQLREESDDVRLISLSGFEPSPRAWADDQVVKCSTMVEDLHRALARDGALSR